MDVLQQPFQTANHVNLFHEFDFDDNEDDVFYSELRKQVLQLTAEDDEDQVFAIKNSEMEAVKANKPGPNDLGYYGWPAREIRVAPAWISNIGRPGNGTGVFIPQTVQSKRRHRSRRKKNEKKSKQQDEKRT